jgi:hypothetical protein
MIVVLQMTTAVLQMTTIDIAVLEREHVREA